VGAVRSKKAGAVANRAVAPKAGVAAAGKKVPVAEPEPVQRPRWVKWGLAAAVGAAALVGLALSLPARGGSAKPLRAEAPAKQAITAPAKAPQQRLAPGLAGSAAPEAPLPPSLQGTEVDGGLDVLPNGHLAVGPRVIQLFDYFFSATGEEKDATIQDRIRSYARKRLTEPALGEALGLLDHYVAYRNAARTLRADETATAAERLEVVKRLRREHFGSDADALFGADEHAVSVAIEKSRAAKDPSLSPDERADAIAAAEQRLPEADQRMRAETTSVTQLREDEATLRAAGADDAEIHRFRAGTLGEDAANRLDELDRQRAAWKARIEAFRRERDLRCASAADAAACETALLESSFDERERLRVRAILSSSAN
jgi:lipase chaperone LimK